MGNSHQRAQLKYLNRNSWISLYSIPWGTVHTEVRAVRTGPSGSSTALRRQSRGSAPPSRRYSTTCPATSCTPRSLLTPEKGQPAETVMSFYTHVSRGCCEISETPERTSGVLSRMTIVPRLTDLIGNSPFIGFVVVGKGIYSETICTWVQIPSKQTVYQPWGVGRKWLWIIFCLSNGLDGSSATHSHTPGSLWPPKRGKYCDIYTELIITSFCGHLPHYHSKWPLTDCCGFCG